LQCFIDRAIGQWSRRLECFVQQQGGHIKQLTFYAKTADNTHVVVNLLKRVVTKSSCYQLLLLNTGIPQGSVASHLRCDGIFSDSIITNFLLIWTVK